MSTIVARYPYLDRFGNLLFEIVREEPKKFYAQRPVNGGGFQIGLGDVERILFNLPEILSSPPEPVYICEGEKDAQRLKSLGFVATTNPFGASAEWTASMTQCLAGRDCILLADNDAAGLLHTAKIRKSLYGVAASSKIVWLPGEKGGDISDFLNAGGTVQEFQNIVAATPFEDAPTASTFNTFTEESDWPNPLPLQPELLAVPSFDISWLPDPFCALVSEISNQMQLPCDFAATATLVSLSGCIGRRAIVLPKHLNERWQEPLNLWAANIGNVGLMKSPTMQLIFEPLADIQAGWMKNREAEEDHFQKQQTLIKLQQEVWEQNCKKAMKDGTSLPARPDDTAWPPGQRRLLCIDATMEKLHTIMGDNPSGICCTRDELTGLISDLNKTGRESERSFWLQSWNGKGAFAIDRITRGSVWVEHICTSLFGNLVPSRLRHYLSSVLAGGTEDDGFFSRILMCWPDLSSSWRYVDSPSNIQVTKDVREVYEVLTDLSGWYPLRLRFSTQAQEIFVEWLTALENAIRGDALPGVLAGHFSKYRKFLPVIAGILEMVDRAVSGALKTVVNTQDTYSAQLNAHRKMSLPADVEELPHVEKSSDTLISSDNLKRAISICDYYQAHARRVYGSVTSPELRAANSLAKHLQAGDLPQGFTSRDVLRKCWSDISTGEAVNIALRHLEDLHWVRALAAPASAHGGRPTVRWEVNPKVSK